MEEKLPARRNDIYRTEKVINPKKEITKEKYYTIYEDYITNFQTELQLAKKYNLHHTQICKIIKWATLQFGTTKKKQRFREMFDRLSHSLRRLENMYKNADNTSKQLMVMGEMRRTMKLLAQVEGLLSHETKVDMSDRRKVTYVSGVNRRTESKE